MSTRSENTHRFHSAGTVRYRCSTLDTPPLAYHVRFGKLDPEALDSNWNFTGPLLSSDPVSAVQAVIDGGGVREFVDSLKPQHPFYGKLKSALRDYRTIAATGGWPGIPLGPTPKPGMSDTRIPVLRKRLAVTGDLEVVLATSRAPSMHRWRRPYGRSSNAMA